MIDLHTHSTGSDGTLRPAELAALAAAEGLSAVALTDHDTLDGIPEFLAAAREHRLRAVAGVEISVEFSSGTMHLLGYDFRCDDPHLAELLRQMREGRAARNAQILDRLAERGMPLSADEVAAFAGGEVVGRPHIAQAMVARGYVKDQAEAFERWLAKGRPAYVQRYRPGAAEAIATITGAGGVAVLAHPVSLQIGETALIALLRQLRELGLRGLEAHHPEHPPALRQRYMELARDLGLVATGGSDFHGAIKPAIRLGRGFGDLRVPAEALDRLLNR